MTKPVYNVPTENSFKQSDNTKSHQNLDFTTIADQLRTFSVSKYSYPTCVVKSVRMHPTSLLTATAKEYTLKIL